MRQSTDRVLKSNDHVNTDVHQKQLGKKTGYNLACLQRFSKTQIQSFMWQSSSNISKSSPMVWPGVV